MKILIGAAAIAGILAMLINLIGSAMWNLADSMPKILLMVLGAILVAVVLWGCYVTIFKILLDIPDKNKNYVAISFRQFKALYAIAPDKWGWHGDHIFYQYECIMMKRAIDWILFRRIDPRMNVIAWMPLPEPYKGDEDHETD